MRGFTLLEVMIALIIFGLLALTIQQAASGYMGHYNRLEGQTMANWIAQNEMAEIRLRQELPDITESTDRDEFANREWEISRVVSSTEDPTMRRVELEIKRYDETYQEYRTQLFFDGFVGEH